MTHIDESDEQHIRCLQQLDERAQFHMCTAHDDTVRVGGVEEAIDTLFIIRELHAVE